MKKFSNFVLGAIIGGAAGFLAGSLLVSDEQIDDLKKKVKDNDTTLKHLRDQMLFLKKIL